ncbi:MAG TPA: hypothetical protein VF584_14720 [Longimicrobium sp.]
MPRIHVLAALAALLSGLAPAAAAQPLVTFQGTPIAYRVDVPVQGWNRSVDNDVLTVGRDDVIMMVSVTDLVSLQQNPGTVSEADQRRIYTQRFMGSDSIMMALMTRVVSSLNSLEPDGRVLEVSTLGGQRGAYVRGRLQGPTPGVGEAYLTVKDGIMYLLVFFARDSSPEKHQDLFDRVHRSFVLAEAPPR